MIEGIDGLTISIAAAVSDPQAAARAHYRIERAGHSTGGLDAFNVPGHAAMLKGFSIRNNDETVSVEFGANKLAEDVTRPNLQY